MQYEETTPFGSEIPKSHRDMAMFAHISALAGHIFTAGGASFAGPLIIWLLKREEMPFVDDQARDSLNFQLTILIGILISIPLIFIGVGILTLIALWVCDLVFTIIAGIKAQEGIRYRYPFAIRII